jgi:hypothetical protein
MKLAVGAAIAAFALAFSTQSQAGDENPSILTLGGNYYQDSDDNCRHDELFEAMVPLADLSLAMEGELRWATDPRGSAAAQELLLGVDSEFFPGWLLRGRVGVARFDAVAGPAGMIEARNRRTAGEVRLRVERAPLSETAEMMRNEVMFTGLDLGGRTLLLGRRVSPSARLLLRDYSDNNGSIRVRGDLPFAVLLAPVRWQIGYRQDFASFRRQSGSGYFDPDELHSFQGVSSIGYWAERAELYAEIFGGGQSTKRYGTRIDDQFLGFYVEGALRVAGSVRVALTVEGDDYALGAASGFRHVQAGVRISIEI